MTQEIARRLVDGEWVTDVEAQGGGGGGGSQTAWEAVTVPTDAASWTEYGGGSGNWDFTGGVITFTNAGSGASPVILTNVDHFGQAWAVECDVKVADHTSYQVAFNAAAWIYNAASGQELNGYGFQLTSGVGIDSDLVQTTNLTDTELPDENWHTIRMINLPLVRQAYVDGVLTGQAFSLEGGTQFQPSDGLKESRFLLFASAVDAGSAFRNLKAWRIPMPTFPA